MKPLCPLVVVLFALVAPVPVPAHADRYKDCNQLANLDRTIRGCTRIIKRGRRESRKSLANAYYTRGLAYRKKDDNAGAVADYTRAIKLNPRFAFAYNNRGVVYYDKGDYDRAINDFNQAIKSNPRLTAAYVNRGNVYDKKGDYDRAIKGHLEQYTFLTLLVSPDRGVVSCSSEFILTRLLFHDGVSTSRRCP